ncbi:VIP peptides [Sander lucioperca]|nr:VIP peptides [Sander lucioperca]
MGNIQVYKTGAELKANRKSVKKHRVNRVEIQQRLEIRTLDSAADRTKSRQLSLDHMCKAMLQRTGPQLLFLIALCSVLYSRTLSLPYTSMRPTRHADGLFTSGYSKLLGQLSARRYLESLIGKRVSDELMEEPVKRHSDAIFTDNYSRFRKQMAVKKYLNSVLTGKRSLEDPGNSDLEESRDEPNNFQESYDDINVDHLLNNFHLPL